MFSKADGLKGLEFQSSIASISFHVSNWCHLKTLKTLDKLKYTLAIICSVDVDGENETVSLSFYGTFQFWCLPCPGYAALEAMPAPALAGSARGRQTCPLQRAPQPWDGWLFLNRLLGCSC